MEIQAPGVRLSFERGPGALVVRILELELDAEGVHNLARVIWELMERQFSYRLILEMDRVDLLRSVLIGQLLLLYNQIQDHGGLIRICGLSEYNREVLQQCRLDAHFPSYSTRTEAALGR